MRRPALLFGIALALGSTPAPVARSSTPILVELFTSEGCSSCPPADSLLQHLIETPPVAGAEIIGLGEHVDYWDHQGWRDRFSSADYTERQQRYSSRSVPEKCEHAPSRPAPPERNSSNSCSRRAQSALLGARGALLGRAPRLKVQSIYTPQMIVDGRSELVGSDVKAARLAIERAAALAHGVVSIAIELSATNHVTVAVRAVELPALSPGDHADFLLAITEDRLQSNVRAGENRGRALSHAAVVRRLRTIGEAIGDAASVRADVKLEPDWQRDNVRLVAFVQERASRHVIAAAAVPLQSARR